MLNCAIQFILTLYCYLSLFIKVFLCLFKFLVSILEKWREKFPDKNLLWFYSIKNSQCVLKCLRSSIFRTALAKKGASTVRQICSKRTLSDELLLVGTPESRGTQDNTLWSVTLLVKQLPSGTIPGPCGSWDRNVNSALHTAQHLSSKLLFKMIKLKTKLCLLWKNLFFT